MSLPTKNKLKIHAGEVMVNSLKNDIELLTNWRNNKTGEFRYMELNRKIKETQQMIDKAEFHLSLLKKQ
jgi:hypothetical protein